MMFRTTQADQRRVRRFSQEPSAARGRAHPMMELQRTIGNQAVLRLLEKADSAVESLAALPRQAKPPCACGGVCPKCAGRAREGEERIPWFRSTTPAGEVVPARQEDDEAYDDTVRPPDQCACGQREESEERSPVRERDRPAPREGDGAFERPREAGWWTGDWYKDSNTIICDGAGSLTLHESTTDKYGVQDCTRKHEAQHRSDWYARYGNKICKDRKKGDLPHFDPPGKDAYADFLKKSECAAWKIGKTCRDEALAACKDKACKDYVTTYTTQAAQMVKKYCGA